MGKRRLSMVIAAASALVSVLMLPSGVSSQPVLLAPASMPRIGTVDERYQSYNVEMLEVTGGRFWRPYSAQLEAALRQPAPANAAVSSGDTPAGMNASLYE